MLLIGSRRPLAGFSLVLALALSAACSTPGLGDGVQALQFADIPVPAGMRLQDEYHASDSLQIGDYRYANFLYAGGISVAEASSYMRERMPQHAWQLVDESGDPQSGQLLRFERGRYRADCQLTRRNARTTLQISVRTEIAAEK